MTFVIKTLLFIHVISGFTALITGMIALLTQKGHKNHNKAGKIYAKAMLSVFVTAIIVSAYKFIPFLFMIAFISYYSVFSGVRILKLKNLYKDQKPKWYDWTAGFVNLAANLAFIGFGIYSLVSGNPNGTAYLSIGFGIGGCLLSYTNLKPFFKRPDHKMYWWLSHMGNMIGGYIATTTAFSTTIFGILGVNSVFVWIWPAIIGIPLTEIWQKRYKKKFGMS